MKDQKLKYSEVIKLFQALRKAQKHFKAVNRNISAERIEQVIETLAEVGIFEIK